MTFREESGVGWRMILGDCLDVMPTLGKVTHVICDPPYEVEAHTKQRRALKDNSQKRGVANRGEVRRVDACLDFAAITSVDRCAAAVAFAGLASRWTIAFCQIEAVAAWRDAFVGAGLDWIRGGVWRKPDGMPQFTGDRPGTGVECMAIAHPSGKKKWNGGGASRLLGLPAGARSRRRREERAPHQEADRSDARAHRRLHRCGRDRA